MRAPITDKQLLEMMWNRFPEIMRRGTDQPAQRKPLTDDEIWDAYVRSPVCVSDSSLAHLYAFARAVEAAHGINEKP